MLKKEGVWSLSPFKSSTGLYENVAGFLCYLFAFVGGIFFIAIERRSRFVLFHALQSSILFAGLMVFHMLSGFLPLIGIVVNLLLTLLGVTLWVVMMLASLQGKWLKLPLIGDMAEKQLNRM
ncbi:Chloroplast import component protein (Tic20) [compost metagenome]